MKVKDLVNYLTTKCKPEDNVTIEINGTIEREITIDNREEECFCPDCETMIMVYPEFVQRELLEIDYVEGEIKFVTNNLFANIVTLSVNIYER